MNPKKKHKKLYDQIPEFSCVPGCNDCCGPIPFSRWEWKRIKDKRPANGLECPYVNADGLCDIYYQRPFMCRLFGTVDNQRLICPHGCGPGKMLTDKQGKELTDKYLEIIR